MNECEMCEWYNEVLGDFRGSAGPSVVRALTEAFAEHKKGHTLAESPETPADTEVYAADGTASRLVETEVVLDTDPD